MKRFWAPLLLSLSIIGPTWVGPQEILASQLSISQTTTNTGDVVISWNPDAFERVQDVSLKVGYYFEDKGKKHFFGQKDWDASLGEAVFRNLSLDETLTFSFRATTDDDLNVTAGFEVTIPAPDRQRSITQNVSNQLDYVDAHWQTRINDTYTYITDNDCANFASQTLAARGLEQTAIWNQRDKIPTTAWVSATALNAYLRGVNGVKRLDADERQKVKLGDLVFFDWDKSGDSDHVGVVNNIQKQADGTVRIFYAGHTSHKHYRSVDWAIQVLHPNARVEYLSLPLGQ